MRTAILVLILLSGCRNQEGLKVGQLNTDADGDGYLVPDDCDDDNAEVHPEGEELPYDGIDNDCDETTPDDDLDGDGYLYANDCNDSNADIHPDASEVCDDLDNDCNGAIDDSIGDTWYADFDGDGYGDPGTSSQSCEGATGYVADAQDCDDAQPTDHPGGVEICDGRDNDCNGTVDESTAVDAAIWYPDVDGDGYGAATQDAMQACEQPSGYADNQNDCDDADAGVHPTAAEICNGLDDDCNGWIDAADPGLTDGTTWYRDADGDGFGDPNHTTLDCNQPSGHTADNTDCDDLNAAAFPGGTEVCDGLDNDCDGVVDPDTSPDATTWYADTDGDSYGDPAASSVSCNAPSGAVEDNTDCDDGVAAVNPGAAEICDSIDNDCDGTVDEPDAIDAATWYLDHDSDGFGDASQPETACDQPASHVADTTDCDDLDPSAFPGGTEVCDGADNDCDGTTDPDTSTDASTWYADTDGDGVGDANSTTLACAAPTGFVEEATDCDDTAAAVNPSATETCDGIDNDCDGSTDEDDAADALTFYADTDSDGFGDGASLTRSCSQPSGFVTNTTDCDDADASSFPGGTEVCDGADNDCDGTTDPATSWWDSSVPYRIPVTLTAAAFSVDGPPVALDVDFAAALATLGASGSFAPESLRVILQDCALGQPALPSQFLDLVWGLFDKQDHSDAAGDGAGSVVFLYEEDEDTTSLEQLASSASVEIALYFDTSGTDPAYTTGLNATTSELSNAGTTVLFDATKGGLVESLVHGASPILTSQTTSCCGNGGYVNTTWSQTPMYTTGAMDLQQSGPVVAMLETTGAIGGYDFSYTYFLFDGRPELWAKTHHVTNSTVVFNHPNEFVSGIRPWESRQDAISSGATFTTDPAWTWANVNNGAWGLSFGYQHPPTYPAGLANYNPYIIVIGADYAPSGSGTPFTLPAGVHFIDYEVMLLHPHEGTFTTEHQDTLSGLMEGVSSVQRGAEGI